MTAKERHHDPERFARRLPAANHLELSDATLRRVLS
jgi:hypothetical protein